jgi:hypothetical protein
MKTSKIQPGLEVKVFDSSEPPSEWCWFTISKVQGKRVHLVSSSGATTWAFINEIFIPA